MWEERSRGEDIMDVTAGEPLKGLCRRIVREHGIANDLRRCQVLSGGYSHTIVNCDDHVIARLSNLPRGEAQFQREREALLLLAGLPGIPSLLGWGTHDGWHYLLVTRLPGENLFRAWLTASAARQRHWLPQLAHVMRRVHALRADTYLVGMWLTTTGPTWLDAHDAHMTGVLTALRQLPVPDGVRELINLAGAYYAEHRETLRYAVGPCMVHGDLQPYNVIVDGPSLTGVIDWEWAHGAEPDIDLADMVRWALFPKHPAEEALEDRVSAADYALLIPALLASYPEVAATPHLRTRVTIYELEYDLPFLLQHKGSYRQPCERMHGWLRGNVLEGLLPE